MAELDIKEKCSACKYFVGSNDILGVCKRFPQYVNKHDADWCGEYVFKKTIADITRESLAIIDGNLDCKAIEEGIARRKAQFDALLGEEMTEAAEGLMNLSVEPKKRGRKPKNAETPSS